MTDQSAKPFLYVVVCAAGTADGVGKLITAAQERNWDVGVIATPQGRGFIDEQAVEAQTGRPIRSAWRTPDDPRPFPSADAIVVAPATFNTINKWAAGIADRLRAMGVLLGDYEPHRPTSGDDAPFRWEEALELLTPGPPARA
ncbi:flavoprotein [Streptomyces sp. NPDC056486]|uniref:flavoprotein n=1 Tax=Streptomyces sp. NPDC056486 TaxID=3345835 RepID=UPI0036A1C00F